MISPRDEKSLPRVVGRADALALGLTPRQIENRLASGRWRRVLPRTFLTADTFTWADRLAAALIFAGPTAMLTSAAALLESQVKVPVPLRLHVLAERTNRVRSVASVRVTHPLELPEPIAWFGPRRAPVERAVADYARTLRRIDDVRTVVARAVRSSGCAIEDITRENERGTRNGSALLRQAIDEVAAGSASAPEARAARVLRAAGRRIPPFLQNARIDLPNGGYYVADFLWQERRAILEIDSVEYHLDPTDWRRTQDRHLVLTTLGYSVVHRPPSAVRESDRFVADIARWLGSCPITT